MKDANTEAENGNLPSLFNLPASVNQYLEYWRLCDHVEVSPTSDDETFIRSVLGGDIPAWFTDTYGGSNSDIYSQDYDGNAAEVWKHLRRFQASESGSQNSLRVVPVNYFSKLFGGYCSNSGATNEARTKGTPTEGRNPWASEGCPLTKTGSIVLESGSGQCRSGLEQHGPNQPRLRRRDPDPVGKQQARNTPTPPLTAATPSSAKASFPIASPRRLEHSCQSAYA